MDVWQFRFAVGKARSSGGKPLAVIENSRLVPAASRDGRSNIKGNRLRSRRERRPIRRAPDTDAWPRCESSNFQFRDCETRRL